MIEMDVFNCLLPRVWDRSVSDQLQCECSGWSAEQGGQQQGLSQQTIVSTVYCIADAAMLHAATQCPVAGSVFANTAPGAGVLITLPGAVLTSQRYFPHFDFFNPCTPS